MQEMPTLKHEAVLRRWNTMVLYGAGKDKWVMDTVEGMIKETQMPNVYAGQQEVSAGLLGGKRNFLVVTHSSLRDYKMYISTRDFGVHLDVSWYLTAEPRFLKRTLSKYTTGDPKQLSSRWREIRACNDNACGES
jgi:hypothetical protein